MLIDVHAHIFPRIHGQTAAGPTRGRGYGRIRIGRETLQALPPCGSRTASPMISPVSSLIIGPHSTRPSMRSISGSILEISSTQMPRVSPQSSSRTITS